MPGLMIDAVADGDVAHGAADRLDDRRIASAPRIQGGVIVTPGSPAKTNRSRWLSAAARTRTRTSVGAAQLGLGNVVAVLDAIEPAVGGDGECSHVVVALYWA